MTTTNKRQQEIIRKREYWNREVEGQGPDMHNQPKDKHQNSIIRKAPTKLPTKVLLVDRESNLVYKEVSVCRLQNTS